MIEVLGIKNASKIIPDTDDMKPLDPVSENMAILRSLPVKAFLYQDHEAHLQVHMSAMQDPKIAAIVGQNPNAQAIMGAASAHIMEHVAFQYRKEIEKQLGATLPPPPDFDGDDEELGHLSPEMEVQLSQMAAQAAAKLLQKDMAEAQQQQAQQQAQDPLLQLQQMDLQIKKQLADIEGQRAQVDAQVKMQEMQIKMAEQQRKAQKDVVDASAKSDEIDLKEKELYINSTLNERKSMVDAAHKADILEEQQRQNARDHGHKSRQMDYEGFRAGAEHSHKKDQQELDYFHKMASLESQLAQFNAQREQQRSAEKAAKSKGKKE
jgi:hypothetical protein